MVHVVLASRNAGKKAEVARIMLPFGIEVLSLDQVGFNRPLIETGDTFEQNALQKALAVREATGMPAIADDSGLAVDALGGEPGVRSARYGGDSATDEINNNLLLSRLAGINAAGRTARFICAAAYAATDSDPIVVVGTCEGRVADRPRGDGGFGYDPLFMVPELGMTFAELDTETKDRVSHRGRAFRALAERIARP